MKKLIAIIISLIFILEGMGYSAPDTIYRKANLRAPLVFGREARLIELFRWLDSKTKMNSKIQEVIKLLRNDINELIEKPKLEKEQRYLLKHKVVINTTKCMNLCSKERSSGITTPAAKFGEEIAKMFPEAVDVKFWTTLVAVLTQAGMSDKAINLGERLKKQFPESIQVTGVLMHAYLRAGKPKEVIRLGEGLSWWKRTHNVRIDITLMHAYMNFGQPEKAIKLGQEIIKEFPHDVPAIIALMDAFILEDKFEEFYRLVEDTKKIRKTPEQVKRIESLLKEVLSQGKINSGVQDPHLLDTNL